MFSVVAVSGSPTVPSRTSGVADYVLADLALAGASVRHVRVRDLPADALVCADTANASVAQAMAAVEQADGVVLATPVYQAAYSGLLKLFLDLLPKFGLAGKAVLPVGVAGSDRYALALDVAFGPVLQALGPRHVVTGCCLLTRQLRWAGGGILLDADAELTVADGLAKFRAVLPAAQSPPAQSPPAQSPALAKPYHLHLKKAW